MLVVTLAILIRTAIPVAQAEDYILISAILNDRSGLQLHTVTLRGTIVDLQELPPYPGRLGLVIGACRFILKDATGSIEVEIQQRCAQAIDTTRRQEYEVNGMIQVHDGYPSIVATAIRPLGD